MNRNKQRRGLLVLAGGITLLFAGPMLIPVPRLKGTFPAHYLADEDSEFVQLNELDIHLKKKGQGEPVLVLLHGFAASLYTWQTVMEPLSRFCSVIAYDRPGFGLSERPLRWKGKNPYSNEATVNLLVSLLNHLDIQKAILVGSSAGGIIAMQAALAYPERVSALVLVDPAFYHGNGVPTWLQSVLRTPQMRHIGPLIARQVLARERDIFKFVWHDPAKISFEIKQNYLKPFKVENWDNSLWEFTLASHPKIPEPRLDELTMPSLVITGDDDRVVPTRDSICLAQKLPNSQLAVISNSGHLPHEEQPQMFTTAVTQFLEKLQLTEI